jgi:hypothetical protein
MTCGGDYDQLVAGRSACRDRVRGLRVVTAELAQAQPARSEWKTSYEALQQSAFRCLRRCTNQTARRICHSSGGRDPVPGRTAVRVTGLRLGVPADERRAWRRGSAWAAFFTWWPAG